MSLNSLLEIAKTQDNVGPLADAIAMVLDSSRLHATTEILSSKAVKIGIEHASAEEAVTLVNNVLDTALNAGNILVVESACGSCAVVIFNDDENQTEAAGLETAGVILELASPMGDDDDDDDENDLHLVDEDSDVGEEPDDDEDDDDVSEKDPTQMQILHSDEGFKLAQRLHALSCGNNKANFPQFMMDVDKILSKHRNTVGYDPAANQQETAAALTEFYFAEGLETAKKAGKKGFKEGRSGFLSAFMTIISKRGDDLAQAWDSLDEVAMINLLAEAGKDLLEKIDAERDKRGLDAVDPDAVADAIQKTAEVARVSVSS